LGVFFLAEADMLLHLPIAILMAYEGPAKDYEFSREIMEEHWRARYYDAVHTFCHPKVVGRSANDEGVFTFDLAVDGRE
jgi:NTE family protein